MRALKRWELDEKGPSAVSDNTPPQPADSPAVPPVPSAPPLPPYPASALGAGYAAPAYPQQAAYTPPPASPAHDAAAYAPAAYAQQPYGDQGYPQQPYGDQGYPQAPAPYSYGAQPYPYASATKTNGLAITSLVSSIAAFVILPFIASVVAVITGHVALKQLRTSGEAGRGMALAGTIVGWVGVAGGLLFGALIVFWIIAVAGAAGYSSYSYS